MFCIFLYIFDILHIFCIFLHILHISQVLRLEMVGDREVTEDEFMAIVAALPKLRVSIIASWLEKHADGAISPLCCANLWSVRVFFVGNLQNA